MYKGVEAYPESFLSESIWDASTGALSFMLHVKPSPENSMYIISCVAAEYKLTLLIKLKLFQPYPCTKYYSQEEEMLGLVVTKAIF